MVRICDLSVDDSYKTAECSDYIGDLDDVTGSTNVHVGDGDNGDGDNDNDDTNASLYIGDLDGSVTEKQLSAVFSQVAPVVSVKIITDKLHGTSLGYGFVNFNNHAAAAEALDMLNFISINGKSIRVMFTIKDPILRKNECANLFIKDVDASIDNRSLYDMFAPYGQIVSCKVALPKGHAFVQFRHESSSRRAIQHINGMLINGRQLQVGPFIPRQVRDHLPRNVFIKNLPNTITTDNLIKIFKTCGDIDSATVMTDADGRSRGFGFVSFLDRDDAAAAIERFHGTALRGRVLYVAWAQKKSERQAELKAAYERERTERFEKLAGANLYVKNIDDGYDEQKLKVLFSEFGFLTSCKIMVDSKGHSRGFGFVAFSTVEEAQHAMNNMNGKILGRKPLYVAVAERKEERRARLQAYFARVREEQPIAPPMSSSSSMNHQPGAPELLAPQDVHCGFGHHPPLASRSFHPSVSQGIMMPYPFLGQEIPQMYHIQPQFGQGNAIVGQGIVHIQHPSFSFFVHQPQPVVAHGLMGPPGLPSPFGWSGMPVQDAGSSSWLLPPALAYANSEIFQQVAARRLYPPVGRSEDHLGVYMPWNPHGTHISN